MDVNKILPKLEEDLERVSGFIDYQELKSESFGKQGKMTSLLKAIRDVPSEEKKSYATKINIVKQEVESRFAQKIHILKNVELEEKLAEEYIDVSLPERKSPFGIIHPISNVLHQVTNIFKQMGFVSQFGPEVEDLYHNFTALNIAEHHPAREMHDTFYLDGIERLLRTHTSSVQIRSMTKNTPPLKIIAPGKTYRSDSDATHTPMFHQLEVLYIDREVNFANLKHCINEFLKKFFSCDVETRFRPSYFPFTEPSAEVDISYFRKEGKIEIGKGDNFMEILGCGMIHPNVLDNCSIDSNEYQGFAIGMGIERLAMLKYGISDLRDFFNNDYRWNDHYGITHSKY